MDSFHEFFTALSSNTEGLADGAYSFLKALWSLGGSDQTTLFHQEINS